MFGNEQMTFFLVTTEKPGLVRSRSGQGSAKAMGSGHEGLD